MTELLHGEITKRILGAAFEVHGVLGPGFRESAYEKALVQELLDRQVPFKSQVQVPVIYKTVVVGKQRLDLLVEDKVVVELKAVKELADIHTAMVLSYLAATNLSVALLLNFATRSLEYRRLARQRRPN